MKNIKSLVDDSVENDTYCCSHRALGYSKDSKDLGCSENYHCECHRGIKKLEDAGYFELVQKLLDIANGKNSIEGWNDVVNEMLEKIDSVFSQSDQEWLKRMEEAQELLAVATCSDCDGKQVWTCPGCLGTRRPANGDLPKILKEV